MSLYRVIMVTFTCAAGWKSGAAAFIVRLRGLGSRENSSYIKSQCTEYFGSQDSNPTGYFVFLMDPHTAYAELRRNRSKMWTSRFPSSDSLLSLFLECRRLSSRARNWVRVSKRFPDLVWN